VIPLRQITVDVPDCSTASVEGLPSWVVGWGMTLAALLALGLIIALGIVRYHAHEEKTQRLREVARDRKTCGVCGATYPTEEMAK